MPKRTLSFERAGQRLKTPVGEGHPGTDMVKMLKGDNKICPQFFLGAPSALQKVHFWGFTPKRFKAKPDFPPPPNFGWKGKGGDRHPRPSHINPWCLPQTGPYMDVLDPICQKFNFGLSTI